MDATHIFSFIISLILAVGIFRHHKKVDSFFEKHQWINIFLAICFVVLAGLIAWDGINQDKATATVGTLESDLSGSKILLSKDNINPAFELGHSSVKFEIDPRIGKVFTDSRGNDLIIKKEQGKIKVSMKIMGKDGSLGMIRDNEWAVNTGPYYRNYNDSALEILDKNEHVVFWVHLLGDRVQMKGILLNETGYGIAFGDESDFGRDPENEGWPGLNGVIVNIDNYSESDLKIKPVFVYPSETHLGELAKLSI